MTNHFFLILFSLLISKITSDLSINHEQVSQVMNPEGINDYQEHFNPMMEEHNYLSHETNQDLLGDKMHNTDFSDHIFHTEDSSHFGSEGYPGSMNFDDQLTGSNLGIRSSDLAHLNHDNHLGDEVYLNQEANLDHDGNLDHGFNLDHLDHEDHLDHLDHGSNLDHLDNLDNLDHEHNLDNLDDLHYQDHKDLDHDHNLDNLNDLNHEDHKDLDHEHDLDNLSVLSHENHKDLDHGDSLGNSNHKNNLHEQESLDKNINPDDGTHSDDKRIGLSLNSDKHTANTQNTNENSAHNEKIGTEKDDESVKNDNMLDQKHEDRSSIESRSYRSLPTPPPQTTQATTTTDSGGGGDGSSGGFPNSSTTTQDPSSTGDGNGGGGGGGSGGGGSGGGGSGGNGNGSNNGNNTPDNSSGGSNNGAIIGGSIAGVILGAGAISGGLSWFFLNKKKEEERKKRLKALRLRRARLAAMKSKESDISISQMVSSSQSSVRIPVKKPTTEDKLQLGSSSLVAVENSGSISADNLDTSATALPVIQIHSGDKKSAGNSRRIPNNGSNQSSPGKKPLVTEVSIGSFT